MFPFIITQRPALRQDRSPGPLSCRRLRTGVSPRPSSGDLMTHFLRAIWSIFLSPVSFRFMMSHCKDGLQEKAQSLRIMTASVSLGLWSQDATLERHRKDVKGNRSRLVADALGGCTDPPLQLNELCPVSLGWWKSFCSLMKTWMTWLPGTFSTLGQLPFPLWVGRAPDLDNVRGRIPTGWNFFLVLSVQRN